MDEGGGPQLGGEDGHPGVLDAGEGGTGPDKNISISKDCQIIC